MLSVILLCLCLKEAALSVLVSSAITHLTGGSLKAPIIEDLIFLVQLNQCLITITIAIIYFVHSKNVLYAIFSPVVLLLFLQDYEPHYRCGFIFHEHSQNNIKTGKIIQHYLTCKKMLSTVPYVAYILCTIYPLAHNICFYIDAHTRFSVLNKCRSHR